jgi:hypothetical protein
MLAQKALGAFSERFGLATVQVLITVTLKLPLATLLLESLAEQFTGVVPTAKAEPEAGVQVTGTLPSTRSLAVAVKDTVAGPRSPIVTVMSAGRLRAGAVVSTTVTVAVPVPMLPGGSVAVQVTVVVPIGNVEPEATSHDTATEPYTASTALAE